MDHFCSNGVLRLPGGYSVPVNGSGPLFPFPTPTNASAAGSCCIEAFVVFLMRNIFFILCIEQDIEESFQHCVIAGPDLCIECASHV